VKVKHINISDFEKLAKKKLPKMAYEYYASGACDEITLRRNCEAYNEICLKYRVLVDVSKRDTSVTILGEKISFPVMIAPTAFQRMANKDGELATARAASAENTIMVLSTLSNTSVEDVAKAAAKPLWFQLYIYKDRKATKDLIQRVEQSGFTALVLTVDAPLIGIRECDERNEFRLPRRLSVQNMNISGFGKVTSFSGQSGLAAYFSSMLDQSLTWKDIEWLRNVTKLPLILKGIACKEDAMQAVESGADGIVVSNHGGRQLDTCRATIEVLPEVSEAVSGKIMVLVDGGVRRGTDIIKAIALGAEAVLVGRPVLWGLAYGGENGVRRVLQILKKEFDLAMALCGCTKVNEISKGLIA
jgi:4-hydroxymandelate oxidase